MTAGKQSGIYNKFDVRRTDGRDCPGDKHEGCHYFVLDLAHDPHAGAAITAYADSCHADHPDLAKDLRKLASDQYSVQKNRINGMFAKPEAIQPLPADTFEEALRRKQRDAPLASMGFKAGTLKMLDEKMGLTTAWDLVRRINEDSEQGRDFGIAKGMTPLRFEEVVENLDELTKACQAEWDLAHPAVPPGDYLVACNTCGWTRPRSKLEPCPKGHTSGFTLAGDVEAVAGPGSDPGDEDGENDDEA